ncbi:MAG TPA: cupin domain-containing protein [Candidatus Udaeobacter sp.]|jgi:quercetin dioxygenase-like cupin family protein|nr:cupin domain-containing protein [Candidatus Udaeobacter sp.]
MNKIISLSLLAVALPFVSLPIAAQDQVGSSKTATADSEHIVVTPTEMKWAAAPPSVPSGAQLAVLEGDPAKSGPFTVRFQTPDGYRIPPHTHPTAEKITVISGTMLLGTGAKFEEKGMREMPSGSFMVMPAGMQHFVTMRGDTIIQVNGDGPFTIKYVNPADDPRNTAKQ